MYIKRITIQGFKSYKNETIIDSFSPHHNVVVGRNGSGKSNFFAAIRFVLSDAYNNMTREERQSLIHEGSGTVMSAYVEVVFDNSDRRLPIDKDEVSIRRTIGMKKDDYSLNSRSATKSDIMNLLESAGFSRSNPYYIVPQGRVTGITNAKDSEKLELLKEVAGANVFETKLKESVREMAAATKKQEQISEMLRFINSRLSDLDVERESLKEFEKYNNQKKVLEFNLLDREMKKLSVQIETIESEYADTVEESSGVVHELNDREKAIKKLQKKLAELQSTQKLAEIDQQDVTRNTEEVLSKIGDTTAQVKAVQLEEASVQGEAAFKLEETRQAIEEKEQEVAVKKPEVDAARAERDELMTQLKQMKLDQRTLLSKKGRSMQFSSKDARDGWLQEQIGSLQKSIEKKQGELAGLEEIRKATLGNMETKKSERDKLSEQSETQGADSLEKELYELSSKCSALIDERKQLWREESKLNSVLETYNDEKAKVQDDLNSTMESSVSKGLEAVQEIAARLGLSGVYGSLGELIDVSDKYKTAVEVVGGNALFYVVVNDDQTASVIMEQLIADHSGRVTFMPLNRLQAKNPAQFPSGNESVPLIKKIAYEEYLEPAVTQVFGSTLVCMDLEKGAELAKSHHVNSVTLDGDRCSTNGVLSGGFREQGKSRVDCLKAINKWNSEAASVKKKLAQLKEQISAKDSEITAANEEVNKKRKQLDEQAEKRQALESEISGLDSKLAADAQELQTYEDRISSVESAISSLERQVGEYQAELASDFESSQLSSAEEESLAEFAHSIPETTRKHSEVADKLQELEVEISGLESELKEKLRPLEARLVRRSGRNRRSEIRSLRLEDLKDQLQRYEDRQDELADADKACKDRLDELSGEISEVQEEIEKADEGQKVLIRQLARFSKESEKSLSRKLALRARRDDINKKIKDLGLLPENAFTQFTSTSSDDILKELNTVNNSLKEYNHVNKRALEQYISFNKQRDSLVERRLELDTAKESIEELMGVLQRRKNDAIIQTFREVSTNFSRIFEKLVPAGTGRLIIQKKNERAVESLTQLQRDPDEMDVDSDDDEVEAVTDSYVGVSIAVSFNSKSDEQQRIEQLSGGQKSLCALALILAIQSCDPAPFYLFDEIDANLDAQYRASVASLIHELSRNAQFICTTFRREMLDVSDKFFGVMFSNKVSTVSDISRDDAVGFVDAMHR